MVIKRKGYIWGGLASLLTVVLLVMSISPSLVRAHSNLERTVPQPDAVLTSPLSQVELWFEDPVVIHSESLKVLSETGDMVNSGKAESEPENQRHLMVPLRTDLNEGVYKVKYNVIALDGYVITGEYSFEIQSSQVAEGKQVGFAIEKISPSDGGITDSSLKQIDLWFTQPAQLSAIGVFGQNNSLLTGESYVDKEDPRHIIVPLEGTPEQGTYQVTWYAAPKESTNTKVNRDFVGVFYFSVDQVGSLVTEENRPLIQPFTYGFGLKHITHSLAFLGLLSLAGISWFRLAITKDTQNHRRPKVLAILYGLGTFGFVLLLILRWRDLGPLPFQELFSIHFVWIPALQFLLLSLSFWLLRNKMQLLGYGAALLLWPFSTGHSTYPRYGGTFSTVLDMIHLFSISIWMGGLLALIFLIPKDNPVSWVKNMGSKYSKWAFWSMLLIAATGIGMTLQFLPAFTFKSLLISDWGKGLIIKIIFTLLIIFLAFMQRRTLQRMAENAVSSFVRRGRMEMIYAVFILFAAAILIESRPSAASQGIFPDTATTDGVSASVTIAPIDVGRNDIFIRFDNAPEFTQVKGKLLMPPDWWKENVAFPLGDGTYKLTGNFLHGAGTMMMEVTAYKPNGSTLVFPFQIVVPGEMRFNENE